MSMFNFKVRTATGLIGFLLLALAVIILAPIATIWALNTLFPSLAIPYTLETWAATVIVSGIVSGNGFGVKGKE